MRTSTRVAAVSKGPSGRATRYIYALWSQDHALVYVGQSVKPATRHPVVQAVGCTLEVGLRLSRVTYGEAQGWEDRAILALRARGVMVVNKTNAENQGDRVSAAIRRRTLRQRSKKSLSAAGKRGAQAIRRKYTKAEIGARISAGTLRLSRTARRRRALIGWETRRGRRV